LIPASRRPESVLLFLWLANCYFAHDSLGFSVLLPFFDGQSGRFIPLIATMARLLGAVGPFHSFVAPKLSSWARPVVLALKPGMLAPP
jgi:hypothetical protein